MTFTSAIFVQRIHNLPSLPEDSSLEFLPTAQRTYFACHSSICNFFNPSVTFHHLTLIPTQDSSITLWPGPHAGSTGLARTLPKPLSSTQVLGFFSTLYGPRNSLAAQHTAAASQHRLLLLPTQPRDRLVGIPGLRSSPGQPTLASVRARID